MNESNLHNYQRKADNHIIVNKFCALFQEMGLGKTITTLTSINYLIYRELEIINALIIAPKRVVESVWSQEALKWEHTKHLSVVKIHGNPTKRKKAINTPADIHLISRDNIAWLCKEFKPTKDLPWDMLVIDELSSFKNNNSRRFKMLRKKRSGFKRIVGLTGTPSPNSLMDLWPQLFLLDGGERLGKFITPYRNAYFIKSFDGYSYDLRPGADKLIYKSIDDICISMKSKDYLDLPDIIYNTVNIQFPPKLQKQYKDFEKEQILELVNSGGPITAANAAALSIKLRQFANGAIYDEQKNWHVIHTLKLEALSELVEAANGSPILIAWSFKHDAERIKVQLSNYNVRELKTQKDIDDWNAGKIEVFMMHPASGGHGLNLQDGGNTVIWYSPDWSLELYQQLNARLHRQGQKKPVTVHRLAIEGSVDYDVLAALDSKDKGQSSLMAAVKAKMLKFK